MHPRLYFIMLIWKPKWLAWWFRGRERDGLSYDERLPTGEVLSESEELGYVPYGISDFGLSTQSQAIRCLKFKSVLLFSEGVWIGRNGLNNVGLKYPTDLNTFHGFFVLDARLKRKVRTIDAGVLVYNRWSIKNYYHWVTETLPRLKVWAKHPMAYRVPLLLPDNTPSFCIESIQALRPDVPLVFFNGEKELLKVNNLYAITEPWLDIPSQNLIGQTIKELCLNLSENVPCPKKLVFAVRKQGQSRSIENLDEVKATLTGLDIDFVDFESKSFLEQIAIVREAKGLVGVHGANLTNLMFLPVNSWVIEISFPLLQNPPWNRFCYRHLAQACKTKHIFFLDAEGAAGMEGPVWLNAPKLRLAIEAEIQNV